MMVRVSVLVILFCLSVSALADGPYVFGMSSRLTNRWSYEWMHEDQYLDKCKLWLIWDRNEGTNQVDFSTNDNSYIEATGNATPGHSTSNQGFAVFDGIDDYAGIDASEDINLGSNFALIVWMKSADSDGAGKVLISTGRNAGAYPQVGLTFDYNAGGWNDLMRAGFQDASATKQGMWLFSMTTVTDDSWHLIVATRSNDLHRLYIDGTIEDSGTSTNMGTHYDDYDKLDIGRWVGDTSYHHGEIGEVRVLVYPAGDCLSSNEQWTIWTQTTNTYGVN